MESRFCAENVLRLVNFLYYITILLHYISIFKIVYRLQINGMSHSKNRELITLPMLRMGAYDAFMASLRV